jgi:hypothetical protein
VVERLPSKQDIVGSNPIARSGINKAGKVADLIYFGDKKKYKDKKRRSTIGVA